MKFIYDITNAIAALLWLFIWLAGIALAKGFGPTFFTICTGGLYSAYLIIELILKHYGIV
jgi:hypothetical protein